MNVLIIFALAVSFSLSGTLLASVHETGSSSLKELGMSDETLQQLAREKGFIPQTLDDMYTQDDVYNDGSLELWFFLTPDQKNSLIDKFIDEYTIDGIYLRQKTSYYRDQINAFIYRHILKEEDTSFDYDGIKDIFTFIAVMDGDYDDGRDGITILKDRLDDEQFNWFITTYPDKYKRLLYLEKENLR